MKNRALYLSLKNGIKYAEDLAAKVGMSLEDVNAMFYETLVLKDWQIKNCCDFFKVSRKYFLCLEE